MTVPHPALGDDEVAALREEVGVGEPPAAPDAGERPGAPLPVARARLATKAGIRKAIAWYVD